MDAATLAAQGIVNAALNRHNYDDDDDHAMAYDDGGEEDDLLPTQSDVGVRTRRRRSTIEWDLIGTYQTEEEMMAERMKEKVSKRITDHLRVGRKVKYRCNKWKTTRCTFQMYALYALDGNISLYKTGQHNHDNSNIRRRGPSAGVGRPPQQLAAAASFVSSASSSSAPTMVPTQHQYSKMLVSSSHYGSAFGGESTDHLAHDVKNDSLEMDDGGSEADSSLLTQRFSWLLVGVYATEPEMLTELVKERVSKRAANNLVMGRKVTYRCSQYRNTGCQFQMYVLYRRDGYIALYKANQHNHVLSASNVLEEHTAGDGHYGDAASPSMIPQPSSLQTSLSLLVQQALAQGSTDALLQSPPLHNQDESASSDIGPPPTLSREGSGPYSVKQRQQRDTSMPMNRSSSSSMRSSSTFSGGARGNGHDATISQPSAFSLADGQSIAQLLQVASEMDLKFTFNARRGGEYCFEASSSSSAQVNNGDSAADGNQGRLMVLADLGEEVRVSVRLGPEEIDVEMWTKCDWPQFVWAVRGKCHKALK